MKVLIVDDSRTMRMIVKKTLREAEIGANTVLEAANGCEALKVVDAEHPNLILSDWNMPEMNGIEFLKNLRAKGCNTKFGFVTTECTDEVRREATEAGASFFITKPFTPEMFAAELA